MPQIRRKFAAALFLGTATIVSLPVPSSSQVRRENRFVVHNRDGTTMSCEQFRTIQRNGSEDRGLNDALLISSTLDVVALSPLNCDAGAFTVRGSGTAGQTLSFSWPSARGYSMVLLDLPVMSAFVFEDTLADQACADLLAQQTDFGKTRKLPSTLVNLIRRRNAATGSARANQSWRIFDLATELQLQMYERAPNSLQAWQGVTFDSSHVTAEQWATTRQAVGRGGWIRIVLDREQPLDSYRPIIDRAHTLNMRVLGQILDSSEMKVLDLEGWKERVNSVLAALPLVDAWEVGNEVNGNWLGPDVEKKVAYATHRTKLLAPDKPRVLTVLWNLGEDTEDDSVFRWLTRFDKATLSDIDVLGLSLYPEDHPMGTAYNRVVRTLRRLAPRSRIGVTELGYGNDDLGGTWWWGSQHDKTLAKRSVARFYDRASRAHAFSAGGTFWWYFLQEVTSVSVSCRMAHECSHPVRGPPPWRRSVSTLKRWPHR